MKTINEYQNLGEWYAAQVEWYEKELKFDLEHLKFLRAYQPEEVPEWERYTNRQRYQLRKYRTKLEAYKA